MHIAYTSPHGVLLILAFIFAVGGVVVWRPPSPMARIAWFGWSWVFFVAAFVFFGA